LALIWFLVRRLLWMAATLWVVFTLSFLLMRAAPGGPFASERPPDPIIRKNLERRYNLDAYFTEQYFAELGNVLRGDLGYPIRRPDFSVNRLIAEGLPVSAALGTLAMIFALSLGLAAGTLSAVMRGTAVDYSLMAVATVGIALPNFVIAGLAVLVFVFWLPLFPAAGWGSARQLVLPALCLGGPYAAYIARLARTGLLDVLNQDYIRTARAKGLSTVVIIWRHALRGGLMPVVSYMGPALAGILTGSLVVEQIFAIPGLGTHFVQGAIQRDYPLCMGLVLLYTALLYAMNLLVDVSYAMLDPRVTLK
jgi:oligopeptide transport system permease protein